ncbi:DUF3786 domain-containing protein [Thermodesulfobacteriota bacterium]
MHMKSPAFEKTRREYLSQVARIDVNAVADKLGVQIDGKTIIIPLFRRPYRVSEKEIFDPKGLRAIHSIAVLLCKYLLLCPDVYPHEAEWLSYKDFKDAAPFVGAFANNTEKVIAKNFSGRLGELYPACKTVGGRPADTDLSYDLKMRFDPLPRVPILLLFNDQDDEFPAQSSVLFERRAEKYLDMECLAIIGWLLTDNLRQAGGGSGTTVM